jgi:hypothetical protein
MESGRVYNKNIVEPTGDLDEVLVENLLWVEDRLSEDINDLGNLNSSMEQREKDIFMNRKSVSEDIRSSDLGEGTLLDRSDRRHTRYGPEKSNNHSGNSKGGN